MMGELGVSEDENLNVGCKVLIEKGLCLGVAIIL
jgi:hypothetical protein